MRKRRPTKDSVLQAEEKARLELTARRPTTGQRTARRPRIVPDGAASLGHAAVAAKSGATLQTAGQRRQRFLAAASA